MRLVISAITQCSHVLSVLTQKDDASSQKNSWLNCLDRCDQGVIREKGKGWTTSVLIFGRSDDPPLHHHTQAGSGTCSVHCLIQTRNSVDHEVDHSSPYAVNI